MKHVIKENLKNYKNRLWEFKLCVNEFCANRKNNTQAKKSDLEGKILVITHSLEKGMGLKNTRMGYGKNKADTLLNFLFDYMNKGYDCKSYAFQEAIAVLQKYFSMQDSWGENIQKLKEKYNKLIEKLDLSCIQYRNNFNAGYNIFHAANLNNVSKYNFKEFLSLRHSIRNYKDEIVSEEVMKKAVELANMGPSACNRQPAKVYCTRTKEEANYIDSIITGTTGFKKCIPNFAIITEDRAYFTGPEQFQWYINGGIYAAYFSLALHSLGIGHCIMQWFAFYKTQKKLKDFFSIGKTEAIIAVVGYGYCADEVKCIEAQRKSVSDTLFFKKN